LKGYARNENVRRELEGRGYRLVLEDGELILEEVVINSSQNRD
jgi:hypothetical protein